MKKMSALNQGILTAVCASVVLCGCHKKETPNQGRPPTPVHTTKVQVADVPVYLPSFGRLKALNDVDVMAQVSGKVIEAAFDEGATVKQGDLLFRIESDTYQALVNQAQANVEGDKAALDQKKATLKRNKLLKEQALISQDDYDKLTTEVDAAQAALDAAQAALDQALINLDHCSVTSPVYGVTGKRLVDPGNVVAAGSQKLVNVQTTDPLYLDFSISESYLADIRKAMAAGPVKVLIVLNENAGDAGIFQGALKMINNAVDTQNGTISLRAVVDNPNGALWPGQFVTAYPVIREITNAVVAPLSSVTQGKDGPYSFIIRDGKAALVPVTKGPVVGDAIVVTSGLKKDDVVVTDGQLGLWPGATVAIQTTLESDQQAAVKKKLANPNVTTTIRAMIAAGATPEEVELFTGIPVDNLQAFFPKTDAAPVTPDAALVQKMIRGGMSIDEVAKVTGMTPAAIQQAASASAAPTSADPKTNQ